MPAPTTPKLAKTRQLRNGLIQALSSNGTDIYNITIGTHLVCTCPAGTNGRRCYHVRTAAQFYPAFWPIRKATN